MNGLRLSLECDRVCVVANDFVLVVDLAMAMGWVGGELKTTEVVTRRTQEEAAKVGTRYQPIKTKIMRIGKGMKLFGSWSMTERLGL